MDADRQVDVDAPVLPHFDLVLAAAVGADEAHAPLLDHVGALDHRVTRAHRVAREVEALEIRRLYREHGAAPRLAPIELPRAEHGVRAPAADERREPGE